MKQSVTEEFWYDSLNRFDYSKRNGVTNQDVTLNAIGNLTWKLGIGNYSYHTTRKRAVIAAGSNSYGYDANGNMMSRNGSSITYTSYNLPSLINAGSNSSAISYGAFRNRYKQVAVTSGVTETTIYLAGLLERVTKGSITEYRHKIHGGNGVAAIYTRRSSGSPLISTYYVHTDHLGSPELITDSAGAQVVKLSFGAYGERRDSDWEGPVSAADQTTIGNTWRGGFTGHEHLDAVGLIHMNGRVYDPVVARFLSRDPFIDGVDRSQGPNGYAYVHNNPLNRIDPSGYCASAADCPQGPGGPGGGFGELPLGPNTDVDFVFRIWNALASGAYGPELAQYGQDLIACFATSCPGVEPPSLDPGADDPRDPDTTPSSSAPMVRPLAVFTGSLMGMSADSTVGGTDHGRVLTEVLVPGAAYYNLGHDAHAQGRYLAAVGWHTAGHLEVIGTVVTAGIGAIVTRGTVAAARATAAATRGTSVLGHYPAYLKKAAELGARRFSVPPEIWARMSPAERLAANGKFLDRLITRGDEVVLTTPVGRATAGSSLEWEINYLLGRGYQVVDDGWRLIPGP